MQNPVDRNAVIPVGTRALCVAGYFQNGVHRGKRNRRRKRKFVAFPTPLPRLSAEARRNVTTAVLIAAALYAGMLLQNRAPEWAITVEGALFVWAGAVVLLWALWKYRGYFRFQRTKRKMKED